MQKERYQRASHTVTDLKYHFVCKTKYNYGVLKDDVALRLRDIIREICAEKALQVVKGNIRPNHIHNLISAPAYYSPAEIAQYLKGKSPYRLQRNFRVSRNDTGGDTYGVGDIFAQQLVR